MIELIRKLRTLLTAHERRRAILVFCLMLGMALVQMISVVSVVPFVAVAANPELVESNQYLNAAYTYLGFADPQIFLFFLGSAVFIFFVASLAFKAATTYAIVRFSTMRLHSIAVRLLSAYLRQPYEYFLGRNSADLGKAILSEVGKVTGGVLVPAMQLLVNVLVVLFILAVLLVVEPRISLAVAVLLVGSYGLIYVLGKNHLSRIGVKRLRANRERFVTANEALSGIKELRIMGREQAYLDRFKKPSRDYAHHQATAKAIGDLPKYGIQAFAFGGILIIVLYLIAREDGIAQALPIIALFAIGASRVKPAIQSVYKNATQLRFNLPALDALYEDLHHREAGRVDIKPREGANDALKLHDRLEMVNVTYHYPGTDVPALREVNLRIRAGEAVAFVGHTGAGKSTAVDLLLGLLAPSSGTVQVDGVPLDGKQIRAWQRNIGYVPQSIYLTDNTIAANIAFGIERDKIDQDAVERAARLAQIHQFIIDELPDGYATTVGERGVRLSGGQRQRLAIARALYHDPQVVVFDEATSALDNDTEQAVMEAIASLHGEKTIIQIAHRLSTVRNCSTIFMLKNGRISDTGDYSTLVESSDSFHRLAN